MHNMSIKRLAIILGAVILIIVSLMVLMTLALSKNSKQLELIERNHYLMFEKSNELRQSSDDLTRFARMYVVTGEKRYYDIYFKILDIRNGKAKRPKGYSEIYWDLSEPIRSQRHPQGKAISLKDEMRKLPLLPSELEQLKISESNSNELVNVELEAFNAMQGLSKDSSGNYTIKVEPDQSKAIKLLFSNKYLAAKENILLPIDNFLQSLSKRTLSEIDSQNKKIRTKFRIVFVLLLVSIITLLFATFMIRKKILGPIARLTNEIRSFEDGVSVYQRQHETTYSGDEISRMNRKFFAMRNTVNDQFKNREQHKIRDDIRSRVLELLIRSAPLAEILNSIIEIIQRVNPNMLCSILLMDKEGKHLLTGAAPSLPSSYNQAIHGVQIGIGVGSCGTAAATKKRVIVEDIRNHPYWQEYSELALSSGLASCWSDPIIGEGNRILGTFAIYQAKASSPSENDIELIDFVSNFAAIAIEKNRLDKKMSLLARVYNDSHEGIFITDAAGNITDTNPAFTKITGFSNKEATGMNLKTLGSGERSSKIYEELWEVLNSEGYWQGEFWNQKKNGQKYAELLSITSLRDHDKSIANFVGFFSDITESKEQQERLDLMAHYDVLTKLPNRVLFSDRFQHAIAQSHRSKSQLAVCFLDLDNFKPINDNFGHDVGDLILVEVANRITTSLREEDTVSRQGGDEFTLLLGNIDSPKQCELTIQRILTAIAKPYIVFNHTHSLTASIGITLYPSDHGEIDLLLRHADQAMYQAKLSGKNQHHFFNADKDQRTIVKHRQLGEVEKALNNNQLELYYQPKVDMLTGDIFGAEALLRWIHPKIGVIPPNDFLPIIEGSKMEVTLGNWVIDQALTQLSKWLESGISIAVSVNISSRHIQSRNFIDQLGILLEKHHQVNPQRLQLEILESSALSNLEAISQIVKTCRETLGVNVALDDFGTGYSSLTHLRNLSADTVKIDRAFVRDMLDDPSDYAIIDGVIGLAASFDREIIAEGVEQNEHGLMLMLMGCNKAQGFGIAKPMQASKIPSWIANYQPNLSWINCGQKKLKQQERKLAIFKLTTDQWKNKFVNNILSEPNQISDWPILNKNNSPCGTWIRRAKQEQLFDSDWLTELDNVHNELHLVANDLYALYQDSHLGKARARINELKAGFEHMFKLIKQQGQNPKLFD